jgi:hypothetical protein
VRAQGLFRSSRDFVRSFRWSCGFVRRVDSRARAGALPLVAQLRPQSPFVRARALFRSSRDFVRRLHSHARVSARQAISSAESTRARARALPLVAAISFAEFRKCASAAESARTRLPLVVAPGVAQPHHLEAVHLDDAEDRVRVALRQHANRFRLFRSVVSSLFVIPGAARRRATVRGAARWPRHERARV